MPTTMSINLLLEFDVFRVSEMLIKLLLVLNISHKLHIVLHGNVPQYISQSMHLYMP